MLYDKNANWRDYVGDNLAECGISWCEGGVDSDGNATTTCGDCIYFSPDECEAIRDLLPESYEMACSLEGSEYITYSAPAYMTDHNRYHLHKLPHNEGYLVRYEFASEDESFGEQIFDTPIEALDSEVDAELMPQDVYEELLKCANDAGWCEK